MNPRVVVILTAALLVLAGCQKKEEAPAADDMFGFGGGRHGRYDLVGQRAPDRLWKELVHVQPSDPAAARLEDDETVFVVLDSRTGEIRQCGSMSGFCIAQNPWSKPAASVGAAQLTKHLDQAEQEDEAAEKAEQKAAK